MLTDRDKFKLAFLSRCADDGLEPQEILDLVKVADDGMVAGALKGLGSTIMGGAGNLAGRAADAVTGWGIPLALVAPPVIGAGIGYGLGRAQRTEGLSPHVLQDQELQREYQKQTEMLKRLQAVRAQQAVTARSGRPMY